MDSVHQCKKSVVQKDVQTFLCLDNLKVVIAYKYVQILTITFDRSWYFFLLKITDNTEKQF